MTARQAAKATARKGATTRRKRSDPLVKAEQEREVIALWLAGARSDEIARATKLSESTVYRIRREALQARMPLRDKAADELREAELQRLDRLQRAHWTEALKGHVGSSKIVLMCIDRRVKMLGLDAPVKIDARVAGQLDAEIEALVEQLTENGLVKLIP